MSKAAARSWQKVFWQVWVERVREDLDEAERKGFVDAPPGGKGVVRFGKYEMRYTIEYFEGGKRLTKRLDRQVVEKWPLYINFHAGGASRVMNERQWKIGQRYYRIERGIYLCPRAPVDLLESWIAPPVYPLLRRLLVQCFALRNVDSNRVYILGYSMGGWGNLHLGPALADYWAAVAASAGGGFISRSPPENMRNTPIIIQVGTEDHAFRRYATSKAFAEALRALHEKDPKGYIVEFREHRGRGHAINDKDSPKWVSRFVRNPIPEKIVWKQAAYPPRLGCNWVLIAAPPPTRRQRIVVVRGKNVVRILEARDIERLTILLDDRMMDLDRPVQVFYKDRKVFEGLVPRTLEALVSSLLRRGDPEMLFYAQVTVSLEKGRAKENADSGGAIPQKETIRSREANSRPRSG